MIRQKFSEQERKQIVERLKKRTIVDSISGCWLWQGAIDKKGYGKTEFKNEYGEWKFISVHRLSGCLSFDISPYDSTWILHRDSVCNNRHCWNPAHLYTGDMRDNYHDMVDRGTHNNSSKLVCTKCGGKYSFKLVDNYTKIERYYKACTRRATLARKFRSKK